MSETVASSKTGRLKFRLIVVVIPVFVAVLLTAGAYWFSEAQKKPDIEIGTGEQVVAYVETLPSDKLEAVARVWVMNPSSDMDWAYAKAAALSQLGRHQEALSAYAALVKTGKARYYVYVNYALTAIRAENYQLGIDILTEAVSKLETDPSLDARAKETTKVQLGSKLSGFKEDAKR